MIQFDVKNLVDKYDAILIRLENQKSQVDIYQIENNEQTVELST
jgi:hypothetical protein